MTTNSINVEDLIRYSLLILVRLKSLFHTFQKEDLDSNSRTLVKFDIFSHLEILKEINLEKVFEFGIKERKFISNLNTGFSKENNKDLLKSLLINYSSLKSTIIEFKEDILVNINKKPDEVSKLLLDGTFIISDSLLADVSSLFLYQENSIEFILLINRNLNTPEYLNKLFENIQIIENKKYIPYGLSVDRLEQSYFNLKNLLSNKKEDNQINLPNFDSHELNFICEIIRLNINWEDNNDRVNIKLWNLYADILNNWGNLVNDSDIKGNEDFNKNLSIFLLNQNDTNSKIPLVERITKEILQMKTESKINVSRIENLNQLNYTVLTMAYLEDKAANFAIKFYLKHLEQNFSRIKEGENSALNLFNASLDPNLIKSYQNTETNSLTDPILSKLKVEEKHNLFTRFRQIVFNYLKTKTYFNQENLENHIIHLEAFLKEKFLYEVLSKEEKEKLNSKAKAKFHVISKEYEGLIDQLEKEKINYIKILKSEDLLFQKKKYITELKVLYHKLDIDGQNRLQKLIFEVFESASQKNKNVPHLLQKQPIRNSQFEIETNIIGTLNEVENLEITNINKKIILKELEEKSNTHIPETFKAALSHIYEIVFHTITIEEHHFSSSDLQEISKQEAIKELKINEELISNSSLNYLNHLNSEVIEAIKNNDYKYLIVLLNKLESTISRYDTKTLKSNSFLFYKLLPYLQKIPLKKSIINSNENINDVKQCLFIFKQFLNSRLKQKFHMQRYFSVLSYYCNSKGFPINFLKFYQLNLLKNPVLQRTIKASNQIADNFKEYLSIKNVDFNNSLLSESMERIDNVLLQMLGLSKEANIVAGLIKEKHELNREQRLEKAKKLLDLKIPYIDLSIVNLMILYSIRNHKPIALKLAEYTYIKMNCKIPNWLQFKINQYILNNTEEYNNAEAPVKNMNLADIYNKPNSENSVLGFEIKNLNNDDDSVFAVNHMKYSGLEKRFSKQLKKVERINSNTKSIFLDLNAFH